MLREAGIDRAKALIAAVGADSANLYISLSARLLNPEMTLVARCEDEGAGSKLLKIGVDIVISPYLASGLRAVHSVLEPTPPQFTETAAREAFGNALAADFRIAPESPLAGQTLREANLAADYGVAVVGVLEPDGKAIPAPNADTVLEPGSIVIVYGVRDNLARVGGAGRRAVRAARRNTLVVAGLQPAGFCEGLVEETSPPGPLSDAERGRTP